MTREETARQAALDRVGDAYVYGAWDQPCTPAERRKYARLSPEYAEAIEDQCQVMRGTKSTCNGCKYEGRRIHDCRGLTSACAKAAGITDITGQTVAKQWNADTWSEKGEIGKLPKDRRYVQLFRYNGSKWVHTGIYIGGGETVDARGHAYGTIKSKLSAYKWTHYAVPRGMETTSSVTPDGAGATSSVTPDGATPSPEGKADGERSNDGVIYSAIVTTKSGSLNVRSGPGTSYIKTGSLPKGEKIDVLMEYDLDGDGLPEWAFFGGDGKQGYVSLQYLTRVEDEGTPSVTPEPQPEPAPDPDGLRYGVFVPCESREAAELLQKTHPGAILSAFKPPDAV